MTDAAMHPAVGSADNAGAASGSGGLPTPSTPRACSSDRWHAFREASARWVPGQILWFAPGTSEWESLSPRGREALLHSATRPVALIDATLSAAGAILVSDGRTTFEAPLLEVVTVDASDVEAASRMFANASASSSPRCPPVAPSAAAPETLHPPSLAWLTPAGLGAAAHRTFEVPRASLRFVIGRGGHTIRRLEAGLGILIGAADGVGDGAGQVSLCGPGPRLAVAEQVVRLVAAGHRSVVGRVANAPGTWALVVGEAGIEVN